MASAEIMREYVSQQYGGSWRDRVRRMPDNQVASIYHRMIDKLENLKKSPMPPRVRETEISGGDQLSFLNQDMSIKEGYSYDTNDETAGKDHKKGC